METIQKYNANANNNEQLQILSEYGKIFYESGLFTDSKNMATAMTKIIAGDELGLRPFQSMQGIDIIVGKVFLKPIMLAGKLKTSDKYDYKIQKTDNTSCLIDFYEKGDILGTVEYTMEDAQRMGLAGKANWEKQPDVMLYNRAMSKGIRMYCPDLFSVPVYTDGDEQEPEITTEFQTAEVVETKNIIQDEMKKAIVEKPKKAKVDKMEIAKPLISDEPKKVEIKPTVLRPYTPEILLQRYKENVKKTVFTIPNITPTIKNIVDKFTFILCLENKEKQTDLFYFFTGKPFDEMTESEGVCLMKWAGVTVNMSSEELDNWTPSVEVYEESKLIFASLNKEKEYEQLGI